MLDTDEIGLFGHSIGGAATAELGRERSDIASIICIDGSMLGEAVPLLNIYAQSHYEEAQELKDFYYNYHVSSQAVESYDILFKGAGNLKFYRITNDLLDAGIFAGHRRGGFPGLH